MVVLEQPAYSEIAEAGVTVVSENTIDAANLTPPLNQTSGNPAGERGQEKL